RVAKIAHLTFHLYQVSDVHQTLVFAFFAYREVEVEAYYEYKGVAPTSLAKTVRHKFSTQTSHLAHYARLLSALDHRKPTATPRPSSTPVPTSTPLPTEIPTATPIPTVAAILPPLVTNTAIIIPTAVPTSTPAPTSAPTQTGLVLQIMPQNP